jgi:hypothetical protein
MAYRKFVLILPLLWINHSYALDQDFSGNTAIEYKYFTQEALDPRQHGNNFSASIEPEYALTWDDGDQTLVTRIFARWDEGDDERTHADIRELLWTMATGDWEIKAGIGKEYWGVTESRHLVDIINQTDAVENNDFEDKLGQPMLKLGWIQDWGTVEGFILPYFRPRTYPGESGRPRTTPRVDNDQINYESSDEERHIDYAVRYSHSIDEWDLGLSYFTGTSRDPRFTVGTTSSGETVFVQNYDLIDQFGIDVQGTFDAWLWKLEAIRRIGQGDPYSGATAGFEYSFYGIFESDADLGVLAEYIYDSRGLGADSPFQDDILFGFRLALNDVQNTEFLIGQIVDRKNYTTTFNIEASRRIGDSFKLELESRFYERTDSQDPTNSLRNDDYIQLLLAYYF